MMGNPNFCVYSPRSGILPLTQLVSLQAGSAVTFPLQLPGLLVVQALRNLLPLYFINNALKFFDILQKYLRTFDSLIVTLICNTVQDFTLLWCSHWSAVVTWPGPLPPHWTRRFYILLDSDKNDT